MLDKSDAVDHWNILLKQTLNETQNMVHQEPKGQNTILESCTLNFSLDTNIRSTPQKKQSDLKSSGSDMLKFSIRSISLKNSNDVDLSSSKTLEMPDLSLGSSKVTPLTLKKSLDLSPFWSGKLQCLDDDAIIHIPLVAFCLGIMKYDSRLKRFRLC